MATDKLALQVMQKLHRKLRIHQYIFLVGQIYSWLYVLFNGRFYTCRFSVNGAGYPGFDLTTCGLYFMILVEVFTNHFLAENTHFMNHLGWTEHEIMVLKPANKCKIIWQCHNFENILIDDFLHHPILYRAKVS